MKSVCMPGCFPAEGGSAVCRTGIHRETSDLYAQGPFSAEMNRAMIRQYQIKYLVTKDTGAAGGFPEKEEAAKRDTGAVLLVIGRPVKETGLSLNACKHELSRRFEIQGNPEVALIGIGPGNQEGMTMEAARWCETLIFWLEHQGCWKELFCPGRRCMQHIRQKRFVIISAYIPNLKRWEFFCPEMWAFTAVQENF